LPGLATKVAWCRSIDRSRKRAKLQRAESVDVETVAGADQEGRQAHTWLEAVRTALGAHFEQLKQVCTGRQIEAAQAILKGADDVSDVASVLETRTWSAKRILRALGEKLWPLIGKDSRSVAFERLPRCGP
jgi:hypothetical protein